MKNIKKILAMLLVSVSLFALTACGGGGSSESGGESLEDKIESCAESQAKAYIIMSYSTTGVVNADVTNIKESGTNEWEVYGTISCKNDYGETVNRQ